MKLVMHILSGIVLLLISISLVSALPCSSDQIIFRLYREDNSHVANASTIEASVPLCYTHIFGVSYTGANPHQCTTGNANVVVKATGDANAHAAIPSYNTGSTYTTPYCYGDLSCTVRDTSCTGSEQIVARLPAGTGTSNLHVGNASSLYPRVLCCASPSAGAVFGTPQWTTPAGLPISTARVNQTVNVSVATTLTTGVTFVIKEKDTLNDDELVELPGIISDGRAIASLTLSDALIVKGMNEDAGKRILEFTVHAQQAGGSASGTASLQVDIASLGGTRYLLEGNITGIFHGNVYLVGSPIVINHTFARALGLHTNWTILEDGMTTEADSFIHTFNSPGQKTLTLHVWNTQGGHAELQIGVLVVPHTGGEGIMTFIDYPGYYQIIPTGRRADTTAFFQANTSFALTGGTSCAAFTCLGGLCPSKTNNTDASCGGALREITRPTSVTYAPLTFTWEVMNGADWYRVGTAVGTGAFMQPITFGKNFYSTRLNDKLVRVITNYTSGSTSLQSNFTRAFTLGRCLANGHQFAFVSPQGHFVQLVSTVQGEGTTAVPFVAEACLGEDGLNGTLDDCVPGPEWKCDRVKGAFIPITNGDSPPVFSCNDRKTATDCASAQPLASSSVYCGGTTTQSTSCVWEGGVCRTRHSAVTLAGEVATCTETITPSSECREGLQDVTIAATFAGSPLVCPALQAGCENRADTLVCGRPAYALPFFGMWHALLGLVGIIALGLLRRGLEPF